MLACTVVMTRGGVALALLPAISVVSMIHTPPGFFEPLSKTFYSTVNLCPVGSDFFFFGGGSSILTHCFDPSGLWYGTI